MLGLLLSFFLFPVCPSHHQSRQRFCRVRACFPILLLNFLTLFMSWPSASLFSTTLDTIDGLTGALPKVGDTALHILSPTLLELIKINTEPPGGPVDGWNFVDANGTFQPPPISQFEVTVSGKPAVISGEGFKRRTLYAPLAVRDLRIDNRLYLRLQTPLTEGQQVTVTAANLDGNSSPSTLTFAATMDPNRYSPAIHVNQEGYTTSLSKKAMIGYYLGNLGEMQIPTASGFAIVDVVSGNKVFSGTLTLRPDIGYAYSPTPYQGVYEADFSGLAVPGEYQLVISGLGASVPFLVDDSLVMGFVRNYALGLYNQRCGTAVELPFSRHVHDVCHLAPAQVPIPEANFANTWSFIAAANSDYATNPRHTAPQLKNQAAQLYPFVRTGSVDVSGGHHDAGDYSKYTIDSAQLIHYLVFAADSFPGVGALDNLGIPESGDGKSDLLEEAKWETDFLAKMQDSDGGFYFLVYPRDRKYEYDVLPDHGDPQVVWPKNTSATAAATAALAETASSPLFKKQFPAVAAAYLQKAKLGWNFLTKAIARHGKDGSYQKLTQYGDVFMHDDELAWAACALFVATGDPAYQTQLEAWYDPSSADTLRWGWWRLFESYGCAARTYAFAVRTGRLQPRQLDATYLAKCEAQILAAGQDALGRSLNGAYGSAFDTGSKRQRTAGWYFSSERAFDMTVAYQIAPSDDLADAVMTNLNYEAGSNPVNVTYLTGLGLRRQREIVDQYAQNDRRVLPPSGIPLGNIQEGFADLSNYGSALGTLTFPSDGAANAPYPFYDRWGDSYNTMTEFISVNQARSLASLAFWAAKTPAASQNWRAANATILVPQSYVVVNTPVTVTLQAPAVDLSAARIVWEASGQEPSIGSSTQWTFTPTNVGSQWVEAEAALPDGRRVVAAGSFATRTVGVGSRFVLDANTLALYHFAGNYRDSSANGLNLVPSGNVSLASNNAGWMAVPSGQVARFSALGDTLSVSIPDSKLLPGKTASTLTLEARFYPRAYKAYSVGNYPVISLAQWWDSSLQLLDGKWNTPGVPTVNAGSTTVVSAAQWKTSVAPNSWHKLQMALSPNGVVNCWVDGRLISSAPVQLNYGRSNNWVLTLGNVDADLDEVRISNIARTP
jgi:Glycosyl hydrolase family 9/Cellulase N-terminal ig-like domain